MKFSQPSIIASLALVSSAQAFLSVAPQHHAFLQKAVSVPHISPSNPSSLSASPTDILSDPEVDVDLQGEADAIFDSIDINQDGSITKKELTDHLIHTMGYSEEEAQYLFATLDDDSNGEISRGEMRFAFSNYGAVALYMTLGVGGGEVTQGAYQYSERLKKIMESSKTDPQAWNKLLMDDLADLIFDLIDTDQSGEIDKKELREHFDRVTKEVNTESQATEYVDTIFSVLDFNSDGLINREEMRGAFQQYDFRFLYTTLGLPVYKKRNQV